MSNRLRPLKNILAQIQNLVGNARQPPLVILVTVYITEMVQRLAKGLLHKPFLRWILARPMHVILVSRNNRLSWLPPRLSSKVHKYSTSTATSGLDGCRISSITSKRAAATPYSDKLETEKVSNLCSGVCIIWTLSWSRIPQAPIGAVKKNPIKDMLTR